jgi:hypothetical protein
VGINLDLGADIEIIRTRRKDLITHVMDVEDDGFFVDFGDDAFECVAHSELLNERKRTPKRRVTKEATIATTISLLLRFSMRTL